ncbi:multidrug ABC transporter substrate-binding protein [Methanoculleus taiwanensis]|uniref:Multidrug ABC transporter substrate-binding protein n=1 Tax=Methanoculleus taiwanensis TaxID=1550565 RepID=A0A498H2A4_9EURY|nr:ABC transporter permease [Methanoculleus taiwanensis]RXE57159.1 multidrug ABC transporter substrate-binding protein [Methanoculleus taiwanensis]
MIFFDFARRNIRLHWFRSVLAVIGIVIGVIAIASLGILSNSLVLSITETISDVGDTVIVTPHTGAAAGNGPGPPGGGGITSNTLSDQQVERIERAVGQNTVIPLSQGGDRIVVGSETGAAVIYAMPVEDMPPLLDLADGIYPRSSSGALAGSALAEEFGLEPGSRVQVGSNASNSVRVVGIIAERGVGFDINPDSALIVPDVWYRDLYGEEGYDQVIVKVRDVNDIDEVKSAIEETLNRRETVVDVMDTRMILESLFAVFEQISVFTLAIGSISLVVAGVSILNVMMMSVAERTREIGVMRSIGTRQRDVLAMFLYEALILGIIGSIVGGVMSVGTGYLVNAIVLQRPEFLFAPSSLVYILYGMLFGIATSVAAGIYPAWRASRLRPIEALRFE